MFRLLPKRKKISGIQSNQDKPDTRWISEFIYRAEVSFARKLSRQESKLNTRQKKIALAVFCGAMSLLFSVPIYTTLRNKSKPADFLRHTSITVPPNTRLPDTLDIELLRMLRTADSTKTNDSIKH